MLHIPDKKDPSLYRDIVVIYSLPKTASTSLVSSIRLSASDKYFVFHTHTETILKLNEQNKDYKDLTMTDILKNNIFFNPIEKTNRKIYIIDIYRTPIERKISEFFQNITNHFNHTEEIIAKMPLLTLIKRFNDIFNHINNEDYYKVRYNVPYPEKFDFDNKYLLHNNNGVTYIKLRLKDSLSWNKILSKLLDTPIYIINDYETNNKELGNLYKEFKKAYKIPKNYLDDIRKCEQFNYYYSKKERSIYFDSWKMNITDNYQPWSFEEYNFYHLICSENKLLIKFDKNHYSDCGCICSDCSLKRINILDNIKNSKSLLDYRVYHNINQINVNKNVCLIYMFYENNITKQTFVIF